MNKLNAALEIDAEIDAQHNLHLTGPLPIDGPRRVRVIILLSENDDLDDEAEWLRVAARNPAFQFLAEPGEDIYALSDGDAFNDQE